VGTDAGARGGGAAPGGIFLPPPPPCTAIAASAPPAHGHVYPTWYKTGMSDGGTGEKTEEASPQKLKQSREKGQVGKSQDAIHALGFVLVFATLSLTLGRTADRLERFLYASLDAAVRRGDDLPTVLVVANEALFAALYTSLPVLGAAFVAALVSNYMQVGFLFTTKPLTPDIKKINPVDGFKNLFSKKKLVEGLKQTIKFSMVSYVAYGAMEESVREIVLAARLDLWTGVYLCGQIMYTIAVRVAFLFVIIATADFFWQRHVYMKDMMMSKYDVKQEYKPSDKTYYIPTEMGYEKKIKDWLKRIRSGK
jgi:flagellar biosynthetic protein FlhB